MPDPAGPHPAPDAVPAWETAGQRVPLPGAGPPVEVWYADLPATGPPRDDPMLVLHGFPTSSFDWRLAVERFRAAGFRVVLLDFPGFGLSGKPDQRYSIHRYADAAEAVAAAAGLRAVTLVTHDLGDSVGGELLARDLEGRLGFAVSGRLLTNGSIYMDLVRLTPGQQMLLDLPDARFDLTEMGLDPAEAFMGGVAATCAPELRPDRAELEAAWRLAARDDGHTLLARTIRYIEDRRREEHRYTGAIEQHPSPLGVVWGALDPVAVVAMAHRLAERRPDARLTILDDVGHYPMLEAPARFADAALALLP